jgi:hypothetical protein
MLIDLSFLIFYDAQFRSCDKYKRILIKQGEVQNVSRFFIPNSLRRAISFLR